MTTKKNKPVFHVYDRSTTVWETDQSEEPEPDRKEHDGGRPVDEARSVDVAPVERRYRPSVEEGAALNGPEG